jgi:hypothetical protein
MAQECQQFKRKEAKRLILFQKTIHKLGLRITRSLLLEINK